MKKLTILKAKLGFVISLWKIIRVEKVWDRSGESRNVVKFGVFGDDDFVTYFPDTKHIDATFPSERLSHHRAVIEFTERFKKGELILKK